MILITGSKSVIPENRVADCGLAGEFSTETFKRLQADSCITFFIEDPSVADRLSKITGHAIEIARGDPPVPTCGTKVVLVGLDPGNNLMFFEQLI